jgi:hypothetical protein
VSTLRYGVGIPILASGIAGFLLLLWQDPRKGLLVALFPVTYYLLVGSGTVFARYMLPVVPFLCLAAGYAVTEAARWLAGRLGAEGGHVFRHEPSEVAYVKARMRRRDRPDLVIVQSTPFLPVPDELARVKRTLTEEYDVGFARTGVGSDPANIYDWQDQFFLPLAGFKGVERPGPNLTIYIRRGAIPDVPRRHEGSVGVR